MNYINKKTVIELQKLELQRKKYSVNMDYSSLRMTYKKIKRINKNSGRFWDSTFSQPKIETNFIENDRNISACRWLNRVAGSPKSRVLNIGCGDGKFESIFLVRNSCVQYEGIDFAPKSVRKLKRTFPRHNFYVKDITKTKLSKNKYDAVCAFEVLEHISDTKILDVYQNIFQSLKQGGYLLVAVPLNEPLVEMFPVNPNEHVRMYSKEVIFAELIISGFNIIRSKEFIAFKTFYRIKKILSSSLLRGRWNPNDILILAQKK